jgi:ABC-type xylose transport system substrate-binding protein
MVTGGAKVIIIGAKDGKQLGTGQGGARRRCPVIAYDRLIENTAAVNYYVAFDNFKVGQLQGRLLDGLAQRAGHGRRTTSSCSPDPRTTPTRRSSSTAPWTCCSRRSTTAR